MKKFHVANLFLPRQSQRRGTKRCDTFNDGAAKLPGHADPAHSAWRSTHACGVAVHGTAQ
jgi:hypothetical protein